MCMDGYNQICFTSNGVFFISILACIYNQYIDNTFRRLFLFVWKALSLKRDYHPTREL